MDTTGSMGGASRGGLDTASTTQHSICVEILSPGRSVVLHGILLGLPTIIFCTFLLVRLRQSVKKLTVSQSHVMIVYYSFLWIITVSNLVLGSLRMFQHAADANDRARQSIFFWIIPQSALVMMEVSVLVFLCQGYLVSGHEALRRTLALSGCIAAVDATVKAILVRGLHVQLFTIVEEEADAAPADASRELTWKWTFWSIHTSLFLLVYGAVLVLPHTRWSDKLPARPSFYRYIEVLFIIHAASCVGTLLLLLSADTGYCIYGLANYAYYALYPPLVYVTFLSEFLRDDSSVAMEDMSDLYYSELQPEATPKRFPLLR
eukprot:jgi/Mesvir1/17915/Mv12978-RA.1